MINLYSKDPPSTSLLITLFTQLHTYYGASSHSQFLMHSTTMLSANIHHKRGNNHAGMQQKCETFAMHVDWNLPFTCLQ